MYVDLGLTSAALVGLLSAMITGAGLFLAWRQARERQLRKDDVLKWSNEVIRTLQSLYVYCYLEDRALEPTRLKAIALDTSVLVEQGRLFFRNTPDPTYGAERHPAYRGYRPKLLDPIVVAHQIAMRWDDAGADARRRMTLVAEDCVKTFVSSAQLEVGRSQTASLDAAQKGEGKRLDDLMQGVTDKRLAALADGRRASL